VETSAALGFGFRCGFLGLLHMEIIQERIHREYNLGVISTTPSIVYKVHLKDGQVLSVDNPSRFPDPMDIEHVEEPYVKVYVMFPKTYLGDIIELCKSKRGEYKRRNTLTPRKSNKNSRCRSLRLTNFYD
jgi:GTP-binding protein LepA